jgi:hypothetical protein
MSVRGCLVFSACSWCLLLAFSCLAAEPMDRPQIEAQKLALQTERDAIAAAFDRAARQCWQLFMVNNCLQSARLQRRQALAPIDKQEQTLRAAQRALSVIEREERLDAKQPESKVLNDNRP